MTEEDLKVFIDVTMNYFDKISGDQAEMEEPYIIFDDPPFLDYTGLITVSGKSDGVVYVTTPQSMLSDLLMDIGETETSEEIMRDFVGEIATTLSGNVRREFGENFRISIPKTLGGNGKEERPQMPFATFVVPIKWKTFHPFLVLGVRGEPEEQAEVA
jgi:chemotaxis protein CheX